MIIELKNIMAILEYTYDIPEKGLVQISGENNNGKSIIIKALSFVARNLISDNVERNTIINDHNDYGSIRLLREDKELYLYIHRERSNCYLEYKKSNINIRRTIREGGYEIILSDFGFCTYGNNSMCLQIFQTFGTLPFVSTSSSLDYEIVDSIITDKVANDFVSTFEKITYPILRDTVNSLKKNISGIENTLSAITFYDIEKNTVLLQKVNKYKSILRYAKIISTKDLSSMISLYSKYKHLSNLKQITPIRLPIVWSISQCKQLNSLFTYIDEYSQVINKVCPTCGRRLHEV